MQILIVLLKVNNNQLFNQSQKLLVGTANISSNFWLLFWSVMKIELIIIDFQTLRNINKQKYEFNS